ncbi:type II toxin-antitoxin system YafQ family toxin [Marinobacterium sp. BA1]|uniref:type II toxin-antitoxin system YafQ family toxin n=1 Tax=Marinobacterium sp. BA1 TaxID=3138931 RepID=UPI0032E5DCEF
MHRLEYATQFKKDFKKITKLPIPDILEVGRVISMLQRGEPLEDKHVDHPLTGGWQGFRDCHIKPDLVLIYRVHEGALQLARIGSHSELF